VPGSCLDGDPAQFGEGVDAGPSAKAAIAGSLDAAEGHLRLVMDGGAVDMADARFDLASDAQTAVEPVKLMRRTAGWSIRAPTIVAASAGALVTTLTAPGGSPASAKASMISPWVRGQTSEAFRTTVLPQASGTALARTPRMGADASANINRADFGISYGQQMGFRQDVKLSIQVEAVKAG